VQRREDLGALAGVQSRIRQAEAALEGAGRILVRFSGTEPLVRVMVEGPDEGVTRQWALEIAAAVRESLG
jgi:phosphoglucosamine mutase